MPLPWTVYSANGSLVARAGQAIARTGNIETLIASGAFRDLLPGESDAVAQAALDPPPRNPFDLTLYYAGRLYALLSTIADGTATGANAELLDLAANLQALAWKNADAALGTIQLNDAAPYTELHPVVAALLCALIGTRLNLIDAERTLVVKTALVANVGMLALQEALANHEGPPSDAHRAAISAHPARGRELLAAAGIEDPMLIEAILKHHERPDGSGYPAGAVLADIPAAARLYGVADIYAAMILPRRYRDGVHTQRAIREIFMSRGSKVDDVFAQALIKVIGVYPPGIFVRLASGEVAIVIRRGLKKSTAPMVSAVIGPRGAAYDAPIIRDSARSAHTIQTVVARPLGLRLNLPAVWGYEIN